MVYSQASVRKNVGTADPDVAADGGKHPAHGKSWGSVLAASRIWAIMEVVVVLPCVPATANGTRVIIHQLSQKLCPAEHGDARRLRRLPLRVVRMDRRSINHKAGAGQNILRSLADHDPGRRGPPAGLSGQRPCYRSRKP